MHTHTHLGHGHLPLLLLVVHIHDAIVGVVLVRVVALVKYEQGELADALHLSLAKCIKEDLRRHDENVIVADVVCHRRLVTHRVSSAADGDDSLVQVLFKHFGLLFDEGHRGNYKGHLGVTGWVDALKVVLHNGGDTETQQIL